MFNDIWRTQNTKVVLQCLRRKTTLSRNKALYRKWEMCRNHKKILTWG